MCHPSLTSSTKAAIHSKFQSHNKLHCLEQQLPLGWYVLRKCKLCKVIILYTPSTNHTKIAPMSVEQCFAIALTTEEHSVLHQWRPAQEFSWHMGWKTVCTKVS